MNYNEIVYDMIKENGLHFVEFDNDVQKSFEINKKILEILPVERLTVEIIRKRFWDPIKKKCIPIKYFSMQDFGYNAYDNCKIPDDSEFETVVFNGNLIIGNNNVQLKKDWLSKYSDGPYNGSNNNTFYYLETVDKSKIQIGRCNKNVYNPLDLINNYITEDALDGVNLWIKKET